MDLIGLDFICLFYIKAGKVYLFHAKIAGKTPIFEEKNWKTVLKNSGNPGPITPGMECLIRTTFLKNRTFPRFRIYFTYNITIRLINSMLLSNTFNLRIRSQT